jgi:hypothetical protein
MRVVRAVAWWVLGAVSVAVAVGAAGIIVSAISARGELERALPLAASIQAGLVSGETEQLEVDVDAFVEHTSAAVSAIDNPFWKLGERMPLLGPNLEAITVTTSVAEAVAKGAVRGASDIELNAFRPQGGRLDIEAVLRTQPAVMSADETIHKAARLMDEIDTDELIGPVAVSVLQLRSELHRVGDITAGLSLAAQILPEAMGASEPRSYLLMFPNNAELRSQGGNVTAFAILSVDRGVMTIEPSLNPFAETAMLDQAPMPVDDELLELFGAETGRAMNSVTMSPDFPTTAALAAGLWNEAAGKQFDGVLSVDPVALSYVLEAIGPVTLDDGGQLASDNVTRALLSDVYARYPDGAAQDAYFAGASSLVFIAVAAGQGSFVDLIEQLARAAEEDRLRFWLADPSEQELVARTGLEGAFAADDDTATTIGVLYNDYSQTKLDYYLDATLDVSANRCESAQTQFSVAGSLTSTVPASGLPGSLTSPVLSPGEVLTRIEVVGPNGAAMTGARLGGQPFDNADVSALEGRSVVTIPILLQPGQTVSFEVLFEGEGLDYGELRVRDTPMVRPTQLRIYDAHC